MFCPIIKGFGHLNIFFFLLDDELYILTLYELLQKPNVSNMIHNIVFNICLFIAFISGELIGVQYLFQQTGQALQDMNPDSEQTAELIEDLSVEEREEDEGFCDISEDHTITDPEAVLSPPSSTLTLGSSTLVTSSATSALGSTSPSLVPDPKHTPSPSSPGPSGTAVTPVPSETSVSTLPSEPEDAGQDDDDEEETVNTTAVFQIS